MKNKMSLAIATFITIFIITAGIGVISKVSANNSPKVNANPTFDTTVYAQREEVYKQIIANANQQIELANQQIATLANQNISTPTIESVAETNSTYEINIEQASAIAQQVAGLVPVSSPELVNFSGSPAYEVKFETGEIYIDAGTGEVLYNSIPQIITNEQALYIAVSYLPFSQPISMYTSSFNGLPVYVVYFEDGQSVYVSMTGNIIAVQMAAPSQPSYNSTSYSSSNSSQNSTVSTSNSSSSTEIESEPEIEIEIETESEDD
ncbi:MAG: hypothetical protein CVU42_04045 [Chloroflexi bacterium HGW-Chloroflexi-4]|jgi:uncharacterized membrane protein YkoI|nr:MAG: hypothetical protein CVU42_04045 [Chloroflexi bacterium HGW-Chloroflexi-4]